MRRWLILCLLAFPLMAQAAPTALRLCFEDADVHPWSTRNGKGLNHTLLLQMGRALNLAIHMEAVPWKRCLAMLQANEVDGAFAASHSQERETMGVFPGTPGAPDLSKRLHMDRYVLVRRRGDALAWDGQRITNLKGSISTQLGYSVAGNLRAMGVTVDEGSPNAREVLRKLAGERTGGAAVLAGEAAAVISVDPEIATQVEVLPAPLIEKPYYLMLSHALARGEPTLAQSIWRTIERVRNESAYQAQERRALGLQPGPNPPSAPANKR